MKGPLSLIDRVGRTRRSIEEIGLDMPMLQNARHERFAQGIASGLSQEKAYVEAGYSPKAARANAATLLKREQSISTRVSELLREKEAARSAAVFGAAKVTLEAHLNELEQIKAEARAVPDGRGIAAVLRAEELRGRACGLYINQKVEPTGPLDHLTHEELIALTDLVDSFVAQHKAEAGKLNS